jgi:hypothetical protein
LHWITQHEYSAAEEEISAMTIDRMELLRLALGKAGDARDALALAREMEAFVAGTEQTKAATAIQSGAPLGRSRPMETERRERRKWTQDECERAAALLDQGISYSEVGRVLGRTGRAIIDALRDGKLPCKLHRKDPDAQLRGALSAVSRGQRVSTAVEQQILNGKPQ